MLSSAVSELSDDFSIILLVMTIHVMFEAMGRRACQSIRGHAENLCTAIDYVDTNRKRGKNEPMHRIVISFDH